MASILANLSASASIHTPSKPFPVAFFTPSICSPPGNSRRSRMMRFFLVRSSDDDSSPSESETATTTATADAELEIPPTEVPSPSLISALNVEKALRGIAITDVDHYARLGISRGCPYDQVPIAYNKKVEELTKQELEEEELNKQLEQLKESYTILSSVEDRRLYDWSLARSDQPDRYMWPFEADITQTPTGTPPPREEEDVGPTRAVGYFLLGWLVLGFTLSILLNR